MAFTAYCISGRGHLCANQFEAPLVSRHNDYAREGAETDSDTGCQKDGQLLPDKLSVIH